MNSNYTFREYQDPSVQGKQLTKYESHLYLIQENLLAF